MNSKAEVKDHVNMYVVYVAMHINLCPFTVRIMQFVGTHSITVCYVI